MDANYAPALLDLGTAYLRHGDYSSAIAEFHKATSVSGTNGAVLSSIAQAYALSGKRAGAIRILKRLHGSSGPSFVSSWDLSLAYAALGEKKKAVALLQKAADEHVGWVVRLGVDPAFDDLRAEPEFQNLMRRLSVPRTPNGYDKTVTEDRSPRSAPAAGGR
jgi:tetratricopeptide (TPR) repeat protein